MKKSQLRRMKDGAHWFRYWMPYQFRRIRVPGCRHTYLPLNRDYMPLGMFASDRADYADTRNYVQFARDPRGLKGIWINPDGLYLYNDNPDSLIDYFDRLKKLALKAKVLKNWMAL